MTKIRVNFECLNQACISMKPVIETIEHEIKNQSTIIGKTKDYWSGQDYKKFSQKWSSFSGKYDDRIINQTEQYYKYLNGFFKEIQSARLEVIKKANSLPQ